MGASGIFEKNMVALVDLARKPDSKINRPSSFVRNFVVRSARTNDERALVAVLEIPPVNSAETVVRVQIVKGFKGKK
jgi:hypothetical protein